MASKLAASLVIVTISLMLGMQSGCARLRVNEKADYRTVASSSVAKPKVAKRKHEKAIRHLCDKCYPLAEQLLHEALIADASFGPAHNTLGKVYYEQRKFYLAAWEFEHAIKSLTQRAEPVNNLGLVYEAVGKLDDAVIQYELAFSMDPENAEYLGNLLRCRIRRGEQASSMRHELQSLIELDTREQWVRWAKLKLTTDREGEDWRNTEFVSRQLYEEGEVVPFPQSDETQSQPSTLPFETYTAPLEFEDEAPTIEPGLFSDRPTSRSSVEDFRN